MIGAPFASGTLGSQWAVARTEFFAVSVARHEPDVQLALHARERATATIVLAGAYEERIAGTARALPPMGLVVKPSGEVHANRIGGGGARTLLIEFEADGGTEFDAALDLFSRVRSRPLDGSTSATAWKGMHPLGDLVQLMNPSIPR